jgi:hypothetical protein
MRILFTIICLLSIYSKTNAQEEAKSFVNRKDIEAEIYKNTEITIDEQVFDYRVLRHYSEPELRSLTNRKRKQVHFIYTQSFTVLNIENCPSLTIKDIDISKLEIHRKENESITINYGNECIISVTLISRKELTQKLEEFN